MKRIMMIRKWKHITDKNLTAQKTFEYIDRVLILDGRTVVKDTTYTEFSKDLKDWKELEPEKMFKDSI